MIAMIEISEHQARLLAAGEDFEIFSLHSDGSESVIESIEEFDEAERYGIEGQLFGKPYELAS
ncbi:hypothetical protein AB4Y95_00280 [Arthrobacter sp. M-10]|uniref:hypothetical protein n=1 Tax=Arthrobacter sp. M-10 TaxID=3233037 RepID=UPI003F905A70